MKLSEKTRKLLENNGCYIFAFLVIVFIFALNKVFPAEIIAPKKCQKGKCDEKLVEKSSLSKENPVFFANDVFYSEGGEYFRLVFKAASSRDTEIIVRTSSVLDREKEIKKIKIEKNKNGSYYEALFLAEGKKTDIIFEKADKNDGADTSLSNIQVSLLNVKNEKEFIGLNPTVFGKIETDVLDQEQLDGSGYFDQLSEPSIILGQVFVPQSDHITGVLLDFDVVKQSDMKNIKYKLDLREVETGDNFFEIRNNILASLSFSLDDLEKYKTSDGKYLFPIFSQVEKGKAYFIGIDNGKIEMNKFNFLRFKGVKNSAGYEDGMAVVKNKGESYGVLGDLYFRTFGIKFSESRGIKVLSGSVIEDLGDGKGFFKYQTSGKRADLADLENKTNDIEFNENKESLAGKFDPQKESYMIYKFETAYPLNSFNFSMEKADLSWRDLEVSYSFDGTNWSQLPKNYKEALISLENKTIQKIQIIDYQLEKKNLSKKVFIKISPQKVLEAGSETGIKEDEKNYGIRNLKVEGELFLK